MRPLSSVLTVDQSDRSFLSWLPIGRADVDVPMHKPLSKQTNATPPHGPRVGGLRHAELFSVNKSPDPSKGSANFDSVDSCKQKRIMSTASRTSDEAVTTYWVVRDSKDMTMSAVINRGGGRPSKGLRKYIGFRTQAKTAEDVQMIAAAKGMTVTDYVSSAVDRSLREDLALLDHFAHQEELPIRIAS